MSWQPDNLDGRDPLVSKHHKTLNTQRRQRAIDDNTQPEWSSPLEDEQRAVGAFEGFSGGLGTDITLWVRMSRYCWQTLGKMRIRGQFGDDKTLTIKLED